MSKPSDALAQIIDTLTPLETEVRQRTLAAAQAYFAPAQPALQSAPPSHSAPQQQTIEVNSAISAKAEIWMKQNNVSDEDLERVFHTSKDDAEFIASSVPGKSKKDQTFNAYILLGISKLISTGNPFFEDKEARELCVKQGCYDSANHATYFKDKSNELAGTKEKGWTVTAPGLKSGALLVKELASTN